MRSANEIAELWRYRRDRSDIPLARMRRIRDVYNGDIVLPFAEQTEPAVANLIMMGIDQKAGRIASVVPQVFFPPTKPGTKSSEEAAVRKSEAISAWWDQNNMRNLIGQRARHLVAYGKSVVMLNPDAGSKTPRWSIRNPLGCFESDESDSPGQPVDVICSHTKPFAWLKYNYPQLAGQVNSGGHYTDHSQIILLEYTDAEHYALTFAGIDITWQEGMATQVWEVDQWAHYAVDLKRLDNRAGRPLAAIAHRPVLDREQGEMDQMVGMYGAQAKLMALQLDAIEKDIYPDTYLVSRAGEQARFVKGPFDGRSGEVNVVAGGEIETVNNQPGWMTEPTIDRLERAQRLTGGVPAEFGGESTTNVRTGRRGDSILSAVIDFPLAEAQDAIADSLKAEDSIAIDIAKGWWGGSRVDYYYSTGKKVRSANYVPNELFTGSDYHKITYPVAGADLNNLIVGIGQRIGLGTMSKRTAAELDPLIDDPEFEADRITSEGLDTAMLAALQNAAANGQMPPQMVSRVAELVRSGKVELADAVAQAEQEMAQAQQQAAAPAEAVAAQAAAEGMGRPEAIPPVGEPGAGMGNLSQIVNQLRNTGTRASGAQVLGGQ